jgi:long-subunit acyl-CoA synthetase (AMP-forming)
LRSPSAADPGALSYADVARAADEIAAGLAALGIEAGDRVAILCSTRAEWTLADVGALSAGATVVPIYNTNSAEECEYVLTHSSSRAVFCEDAAELEKVGRVRERCPQLEQLILLTGTAPGALALHELRGRGRALGGLVRETRWISQAIAFGDNRPYLVALLTLDGDEAVRLAERVGAPSADLAALSRHPGVRAELQASVDAVNERLARIEQIKRFAILDHDLSQAAGELTPTLKIKRRVVAERYHDLVKELYS